MLKPPTGVQRCHGGAISRCPHVLLITCNARAHAARAALPLAPCFHLLITHACELSFLLQASDTAASPCLALTFAHSHAATTRCHAATAPCYNDATASPSHAPLMLFSLHATHAHEFMLVLEWFRHRYVDSKAHEFICVLE